MGCKQILFFVCLNPSPRDADRSKLDYIQCDASASFSFLRFSHPILFYSRLSKPRSAETSKLA